jgi:hypothetical protein
MNNRWLAAVALIACSALSTAAQDKAAPQPPEQQGTGAGGAQPRPPAADTSRVAVPLKVTVALSRYRGEKRISNLPYMLGVTANGTKTTLRMGVDVPVAQTVFQGVEGKSAPTASYNYRPVGTNIDCTAFSSNAAPGLFELAITISDSSVGLDTPEKSDKTGIVANVPTFRNFNSSFSILLRDGQTTQYTSATDPVTGEVTKVDVTLNVLK